MSKKFLLCAIAFSFVFAMVTFFFSPMIWMGLFLGPLPPLVLGLLVGPAIYYSIRKYFL